MRDAKPKTQLLKRRLFVGALLLLAAVAGSRAANGTWTYNGSGIWSNTANWAGGVVADGSGNTADFSTIAITANRVVTLDTPRSLGALRFGNPSGSSGWSLNSSGGSVLTMMLMSTPSITVSNNTATVSLSIAGNNGLTKLGGGALLLAGANTYTGATTAGAGILSISGTGGGPAASGTLTVGNSANTPAILNILPGANFTNYTMAIGGNATGPGAVFQSGGSMTQMNGANVSDFRIGGVGNSYGYYQLSGGTLTVNEVGVGSDQAGSIGVMDLLGGNYVSTGYVTLARGTGSMGVLNVAGGSMALSGTTGGSAIGLMWNGSGSSYGVLNIYNGGAVIGPNNTAYLANFNPFNAGGTAQTGIINLGVGGTLEIGGVKNSLPGTGTSLFNFNGGTLKATVANASFFPNSLSGAYDYGGATIDDNGAAITIAQPLLAPSGYGVSSISLSSGGSGYIGAPLVLISGGSGIGATAIAQFNPATGSVTNIIVMSPGSGYAAGDVLAVTFNGGGGTGAAVNPPVLAANTSGGLDKLGTGNLTFSGANTFAGGTVVTAGTLALAAGGSLASSNILVDSGATFDVSASSFTLGANQNLLGSGTNNGAVSTVAGSKIFAGTDGGIGTNTFTGNLTFVSGSSAQFDLSTTATGANDKIVLNGPGSVLTCGGASIGIKCPAGLDLTDYTLFSLTGASSSVAGSFNPVPMWVGTAPTDAGAYSIMTAGSTILLHYSGGMAVPAGVTNLPAANITAAMATLSGQVTSTGGQIPAVKIYYGTGNGGTNAAWWATNIALGLQGGVFAGAISNLAAATTYFYTAVVSNSAGVTWAAPSRSFNTLAANPAILTNLAPANVQGASAILNGRVVSIGNSLPYITLYYGTTNGGTNTGSWANNIFLGPQSGGYSVAALGLTPNTTYYFTAAAVNGDGIFWAQPVLTFTTLRAAPVNSVLTYHYDNARTGANTNETLLVPALVNTNNFGRLIKYVTDGYIYTQPLYVPNVVIPGQGTHNVVYVASEHDTIYAFDADSNLGANGGLLWETNLGISALSANGEFGARYCLSCYPDIVPEVGITGTPVIDPASGTLYVNVFTREVSGTTNYYHRLHALNITNGAELPFSPVVVSGAVPGTGVDSVGGVETFNPKQANQRGALTLAGGVVYVTYAGYADTDPYHGWIMGYNETNFALVSVFNTTPNAATSSFGSHAAEGGIWMGGHGLVVDANTNLYFESGNGSISANTNGGDYADSFLRLTTTNGLTVADYFAPYDQLGLANADTDLGAVGPVLLPDSVGSTAHPHLLVGGGKSGTIYLLDRDNFGHFNPVNNNQIVQSLPSATAYSWSSAAYWNNLLFYQPSSSSMSAFSITNAVISSAPFARAAASVGTFNGGPVVSANGTNNGIVWVLDNSSGNGTEVLYACNATNIAQQLYNSSQVLSRDNPGNGVKMTTPTVANGKVYVGAQYALSVFGLTTYLATPVIAPNGATYTNSVVVTISEATPGATIYYTLDGTVPTTNSLIYIAPFTVSTTVNVSAIAVKSGAASSGLASATFINSAALGAGMGLLGQYWTNTSAAVFTNVSFSTPATLTRTDMVVNFNWNTNAPATVIGRTNFTIRWTGCVQPQYSETYTFTTVSDDGVRLWVNGQLLINNWTPQTAALTNSGAIALTAQQLYNLRLEYFQNTSNAVVQFLWSSPSTALSVVPQTQLYPFTNPPPSVALTMPAGGATYTAAASVTLGADADAPYNPVSQVDFYANGTLVGTLTNSIYAPSYFITPSGLAAGGYSFTAVATDGSGLASTSAPVSITVTAGSGLPYGLTTNGTVPAFLNMPSTFGGSLPAVLSASGAFANTPVRTPAAGLIPYAPNTPLWSDAAVKSRFIALPQKGSPATPDEQIGFTTSNYWTFPVGTVFLKNFDLVVDETNTNVPPRRLETRLLVRDVNGAVYGVTYKWRPDNSDADLLLTSLSEAILITNATGVRTQTWYYPSPSDCLTCHTPQAGYVLGVNTRQLNGSLAYPTPGTNDNQLRTLNRLGLLYPAFNETNIAGFEQMSALTNTAASLEQRARSYLDANCAQCHRPGGSGITFDARYDTPLTNQNLVGTPASSSLGIDNAHIVQPQDIWRSVLYARMDTATNSYIMPPLARSLIDTNAVAVVAGWINSLAGTPALAPVAITPPGGTFTPSVNVTLAAPATNAALYFTLDGSLPTTNSFLYTSSLLLLSNATFTVSAFATGYINSAAASAVFNVQPLYFTSEGFNASGQFQLGFLGSAGQTYVLQASTNLVNWIPLNTNVAVTNVFELTDPGAGNFLHRFYRVLEP